MRTIPVFDSLSDAITKGVDWLLDRQQEEGFWVGMLESNSCIEAQWVLAMHFLGIKDQKKQVGTVASMLNEQRADGSWEVYHNAPAGDINTTVECYAALRCAGYPPDAEALRRARKWIFARGGLSQTRVFYTLLACSHRRMAMAGDPDVAAGINLHAALVSI